MGFFASGNDGKHNKNDGLPSLELLHRLQCRACPLDKITENLNPHIPAKGSTEPLIYILGEAPGRDEDRKAQHFIGKSGRLLRERLPEEVLPYVRWNNVVRTRPVDNDTPEKLEIECCRPSVEKDIAESRPRAIFGMGQVALQWATGKSGISKWRGRRIPVSIGGHTAWFYPMVHPAALLRLGRRKKKDLGPTEIGSEEERAFVFDLKRALAEVEELPEPRVWTRAEAEANIEMIDCSASGLERLEQAFRWAMAQIGVGFDWETFRTRPYASDAKLLSAAIGTEKRTFAFGLDHPGAKWTKAQRARIDEMLKAFFLAPVKKRVHNLAFEMEWSGVFYGPEYITSGSWEDSYNQAAALDERIGDTKPGCLGLDFLVHQHCGLALKELSPLNKKDLRQEPLPDVLRYNGMDAKFHDVLWLIQDQLLSAQHLQAPYRSNLEDIPHLVLTQMKGFPVNQEEVAKLETKYEERIAECDKQIADFKEAKLFKIRYKEAYRPSSNPDTIKLLRDVMELREFEREDGSYPVDEDVLDQIDHPLMPLIKRRRQAAKRLSTYIVPYSNKSGDKSCIWPDGLAHAIKNPFGTVSNRTSAEEPNDQNIPKRDEEAKEVRRPLEATPGHLKCSVDYGQIQARGIAMMSKDKVFVKALWERYDVHQEWAERIARAYPKRVGGKQNFTDKKIMKLFRGDIKNQWTFPLFFGAQLERVAEELSIPANVLEPEVHRFWKVFSGVKDWQEELLTYYEKHGVVKHLDGRLNRAPLSQNQVFNYPIQAVERQIVLDGMKRVSRRAVAANDWYYQPELEIHDDLTFELPEKGIDTYVENIVDDMLATNFDFINVPLSIEVAIGPHMLDMKEVLVAWSDKWRGSV